MIRDRLTGAGTRQSAVATDARSAEPLSFSPSIPRDTMTVEQFIDDTIAVSDHLRLRFDQQKIYLLGHSWGSFVGIQAAQVAPTLFHAYIGMAQVTDQLQSEKLAYDFMLAEYARLGDTRMVKALERAPVTLEGGTPDGYLKLRDKAMHGIGVGTMHDMHSVITGIFLASLRFPEYTVHEKLDLWRGRFFSRSFGLWEQVLDTDIFEEPELARRILHNDVLARTRAAP
jgi:pimeloyl-ACP methyl ester carboxylesterase